MKRFSQYFLLVVLFISVFVADGYSIVIKYSRWKTSVVDRNPAKLNKPLFLVNDFNQDGKPEVVIKMKDLHNGEYATFGIYSLQSSKRNTKTGMRLFKITTSGDYCKSIKFKDIDGDRVKEILLETVSRFGKYSQTTVVRYEQRYDSFTLLKPNKVIGSFYADISFYQGSIRHLPEMKVTFAEKKKNRLLQVKDQIKKISPHFWVEQIFFIKQSSLEQYDIFYLQTPYYVLSRFIDSLKKHKIFVAYKYFFSKTPFFKFKASFYKKYPFLTNKKYNGKYTLYNWKLDYYRKVRRYGWMTFDYSFQTNGGKTRTILYQAFMKKVYDVWRIIKIRKIKDNVK